MPVRNIRRRYIHIIIETYSEPREHDINETIQNSIKTLFGLKGLSSIDPILISYNEKTKQGIIRCRHTGINNLRAALAYTKLINDKAAAIRVDQVSGTIKKLKLKTKELDKVNDTEKID